MDSSGGTGGGSGGNDDLPRGRASAQQTSSKTNRFAGFKKAASTTSFFTRSIAQQPSNKVEELKYSRNSLPDGLASSHDGNEKGGGDVHKSSSTCPISIHKIGSRMKAASNRLRQGQDGRAKELEENQKMTRKKRNSEPNMDPVVARGRTIEGGGRSSAGKSSSTRGLGYMQVRAAHLMTSQNDVDVDANKVVENKLLEVMRKENFCDIEITGKENTTVKAPSFLLACHSAIFEELFYPKAESKPASYSIISQDEPRKVRIEFASQSTIEAAIHFCATLELPPDVENETTEPNVRTIAQLHVLAKLFKIPSLLNASHQTARRLMNKKPHLVCAVFDECNVLQMKAESENNWGLTMEKHHDDLREYVLGFLRESPIESILGAEPGVLFLSPASVEAIVCDQEIDVDEYTMWCILNVWTNQAPAGSKEGKIATARSLVSHIQLEYIDPIELKYQLKKCGFVDPEDIDGALKKIELMKNESPNDKERVIVTGAGDDRVNGTYVRSDDDIGLKNDEVMFLKEGNEDEVNANGDFGLYIWGKTWGISSCTDYFNTLYSCESSRHKGHSLSRPPKWGWKCEEGTEPGPTCTWKPSKKEEGMDDVIGGIAPTLSKLKNEKGTGGIRSTVTCGHAMRESLTLDQMMSLPEDVDYSEDNHRYASLTKDLDAMMNLAVDEGHDDEEAGYNVNYMSATLFCDSSTDLPTVQERLKHDISKPS